MRFCRPHIQLPSKALDPAVCRRQPIGLAPRKGSGLPGCEEVSCACFANSAIIWNEGGIPGWRNLTLDTVDEGVSEMRTETMAVHGGSAADPATRAVAVPIYETVAYEFDSAAHGAALFNLEVEGHRYSRISNPTTAVLEKRIAMLEGGVGALAVASGQAALHYAVLNLVGPGQNLVSVPQLYGTTHTLFAHFLPSLGIEVRFAESDRPDDIARLIDADTRAVFCESVGNPAGNICDIEALAAVAHQNGVAFIVDNTVATPILLRPIEFGADIVVHSLTKFLGGHGATLGGAIVDAGCFDWRRHAQRYPMFSEPDRSYHGLVYLEHFANAAYIARCRSVYLRTTGAALSPISAFLLLQGIETVALRVERHVENAKHVATFLRSHPRVAWVNYVGFSDNPYHGLAQKYLDGRACSILAFGVAGGAPAAMKFYDELKLVKRVVNLGDAKTLACHPASTTHRQMSSEERRAAGVTSDMIRLSIGIEHVEDIIADLDQALAAAAMRHDTHADLISS
jgi:O-acetylhomoserine (thiol)-lyase